MTWPEQTLKTWATFTSMAQKLDSGVASGGFVFRGQADASWSLNSSLWRSLPSGIPPKDALEFERQALREFKSRAHLDLSPSVLPVPADFPGWLALMQHHNAPTRLLDWTRSIYVALYFAAEQSLDRDGAIWYVPKNLPSSLSPDELGSDEAFLPRWYSIPSAPSSVWFSESLIKTERMVAQQGIFSISRQVLADYGALIDDAMPKTGYGKIIVPAGLKLTCLRQLRLANITAGSLFPGVDGLGRSIKELTYLI